MGMPISRTGATIAMLTLAILILGGCEVLEQQRAGEASEVPQGLTGRWFAPTGDPFIQFAEDTLLILFDPREQLVARYRSIGPGQLFFESPEDSGIMDFELFGDSLHLVFPGEELMRLYREPPQADPFADIPERPRDTLRTQ